MHGDPADKFGLPYAAKQKEQQIKVIYFYRTTSLPVQICVFCFCAAHDG